MFFLIHLECPRCGKKYPVGEILLILNAVRKSRGAALAVSDATC
jgi:hypothetical protein